MSVSVSLWMVKIAQLMYQSNNLGDSSRSHSNWAVLCCLVTLPTTFLPEHPRYKSILHLLAGTLSANTQLRNPHIATTNMKLR